MLEIQLDNRSVFAEKTMPIILRTWKSHLKNDLEKQTFTILSNWDYEMDGHSPAPTLYRYWYGILEELTWEDDLGIDNERFIWPYRDKMLELILTNPKSHWFDDKTTIQIETFSHQSLKAFHKMVSDLQNKYGDDILRNWVWAKHQGTDINHVANIPGLGMMGLPTSGGSDIPNATGTTFGPSWRLVVDMGEKKIAYGSKHFPWSKSIRSISYSKGICPVAEELQQKSFLGIEIQKFELKNKDVQKIVNAFHKVWQNIGEI